MKNLYPFPAMGKNYYETLGIDKSASSADIKGAYRSLSKKWHPDKHKGDKEAEKKFKEINEAYEVLGNEKKRKQYDTFGSAGGRAVADKGLVGLIFPVSNRETLVGLAISSRVFSRWRGTARSQP